MNRKEMIAGSAIAVLAAVGIGQLYLDKGALHEQHPKEIAEAPKPEATPAETQPIPVDEVVSSFMTSLENGTFEQKTVALIGLLDELDGPAYAKARLHDDTAGPLAKAAAAVVTVSTETQTPELAELRKRTAGFIAGRTRGADAKAFVLQALEEGPADVRAEIAKNIGRPFGVRGRDVFAKVKDLGEKGQIPVQVLADALRRLGGKNGIEPIMSAMKSADQWKDVAACATALQDYKQPELLGAAFERLEQIGTLDKNEKLPWISPALFGLYMEKAEGSALQRGLRAAMTRPSLVKVSMDSVKRGLESKEPETRRVAAEAVRKAVIGKVIDAKEGETLLTGRLGVETEPVLKAQLTGGLEQVRGLMPQAPQGQQ